MIFRDLLLIPVVSQQQAFNHCGDWQSKIWNTRAGKEVRCICAGFLACALIVTLAGCDTLDGPRALEWPGPHAPHPLPDDIPHRTE